MGADLQFSEFVKRQQRPAATAALDWEKERDEWLHYLAQLHEHVRAYLADYIRADEVRLRDSSIEINEENIGVYRATRLTIQIGVQEITLTPVGTLLIGSKGRVDVEGSAGKSRLVLIDRDTSNARSIFDIKVQILRPGEAAKSVDPKPPKVIDWVWKIASAPPSVQFLELNKDSFLKMLIEVSNG